MRPKLMLMQPAMVTDVLVGAIMEHLEEAGIHSGDSTCFIPAQNISESMLAKIAEQTKAIGLGLENQGMLQHTVCSAR